MRAVHSVLIAVAIAVAAPLHAQENRIEDRMTASEFRAAGLAKLDDAELAQLNEFLSRSTPKGAVIAPATVAAADVETRIAQAREEGRREAAVDAASAPGSTQPREPIDSTITGAFNGFASGRQYTLANGQVWRQTDGATIQGARGYDVPVRIRPGFVGAWWMKIDGYNTQAKVERIR